MKKRNKTPTEKFYDQVVKEVKADFEKRQSDRRKIERQWELNLNYISGNQYCEIGANGEVEETEKYYLFLSEYYHIKGIELADFWRG